MKLNWQIVIVCLSLVPLMVMAFLAGTTFGHSQPVEIAPKQSYIEPGSVKRIAIHIDRDPPPVYTVTSVDEEVYRKLAAVGCGFPCTADHPASKYHCGADEIAWEHSFSTGDEALNCLYAGKSAQACKVDCR